MWAGHCQTQGWVPISQTTGSSSGQSPRLANGHYTPRSKECALQPGQVLGLAPGPTEAVVHFSVPLGTTCEPVLHPMEPEPGLAPAGPLLVTAFEVNALSWPQTHGLWTYQVHTSAHQNWVWMRMGTRTKLSIPLPYQVIIALGTAQAGPSLGWVLTIGNHLPA
jgi:hypothetical protein